MIHESGPLSREGLQYCVRCGYVLTDYRGAMVPAGSRPLGGWADGAFVEVHTGNPRFSAVTDDPPDCERLQ